MVIGVLADTHITTPGKQLPVTMLRSFEGADHIIHAGDILHISVLDKLAELAPVTAVAGNCDPPDLHKLLGRKRIIQTGCFSIGVVHGDGGHKTIETAQKAFNQKGIDCILFGHSHIPSLQKQNGILLLNPGSPTQKRRRTKYSFALLEIGESIEAVIHYFD